MTKSPSLCLAVLLAVTFWSSDAVGRSHAWIVQRVVDGDTLVLSNRNKVRLIGIDTPEVHPSKKLSKDAERNKRDTKTIRALGARSSTFVKTLIQGRNVRLEYEHKLNKDRYDRTLAYVYFDPPACEDLEPWLAEEVCELDSYEKGFLNALLVEAGYANAYTKFAFKHREQFLRLQREARENKRGLWKESGPLTKQRPTEARPTG